MPFDLFLAETFCKHLIDYEPFTDKKRAYGPFIVQI
jgi:hypothetical protein